MAASAPNNDRMQSYPTPSNVIPNRRYRITIFASFCNPAVPTFLYFSSWYRDSRNFYLEPAYFRVGGDEYRRPIVATEAQVGCASVTDQNSSEMLAGRIVDPNPAGAGSSGRKRGHYAIRANPNPRWNRH